jgi:hypothetical protein
MRDKKSKTINVKPEEPNKSNKKEKIIEYLRDLGMCTISTKHLFKFAVRHWITPLIAFIIVTACLIVPPYLRNNNKTGDEVISQSGVLYSDMFMECEKAGDFIINVTEAILEIYKD